MKIEQVETMLVRLPFDSGGTSGWASTDWPSLDYVLIRIDTADGISGWGDAFGYGAAFAAEAAVKHMVAPALIGRDSRDIALIARDLQFANHIWGRYGITLFALSGVDIALWDIAGKRAGVPIYQLLGGARRQRIPAYASLFRYFDVERVKERTRAALDEGYRHIKLHEIRAQEVGAAREVAGDTVPIMVDANCPWTPLQAKRKAGEFAAFNLHWLEEPIFPPEDFASLAALKAHCDIALASGENACTVYEFKKMIEANAVTYLQPSVTKVGGITEFLKIYALADAHGFAVSPHSPYFGPGLLATLHLLATRDDDSLAEFFYYKALPASLYGALAGTENGAFRVPHGPGLGADPDPDVIREYRVTT